MASKFESPEYLSAQRSHWRAVTRERPASVPAPGPGEESVWDYPRPPRLEQLEREVVVRCGDLQLARSSRPFRVCETASPPVYYLPLADVEAGLLVRSEHESFCEWKGLARYWDVVTPAGRVAAAGWSYPKPDEGFEALRDALAFYPGRLECHVAGERVRPQAGEFYGGWITDEIRGPFKGEPGSEGW